MGHLLVDACLVDSVWGPLSIFRAQAVDDEWLKEKMAFSVYRLWDYGHIREIKRNPFGRSIYRTEDGRLDEEKEDK